MSGPRQIAIGLLACLIGLLVAGTIAVIMMDGLPDSVDESLPIPAVTTPMIGVIVYWLVGRAMKVPLEPIRTFVYGALVVYGTFYLLGLLISLASVPVTTALILSLAIVFVSAIIGVRAALAGELR